MDLLEQYILYIEGKLQEWDKSLAIGVNTKMKSVPIMTRLRHRRDNGEIDPHCEEPIDILFVNMFKRTKYFVSAVTLVVVYDLPQTMYRALYKETPSDGKSNYMTYTEFKRNRPWYWEKMDEERGFHKIPLEEDGQVLNLWRKPFLLGATTDYDKDFRKIWRNGDLEYEGNNYGDVSDFYIIGTKQRMQSRDE